MSSHFIFFCILFSSQVFAFRWHVWQLHKLHDSISPHMVVHPIEAGTEEFLVAIGGDNCKVLRSDEATRMISE